MVIGSLCWVYLMLDVGWVVGYSDIVFGCKSDLGFVFDWLFFWLMLGVQVF